MLLIRRRGYTSLFCTVGKERKMYSKEFYAMEQKYLTPPEYEEKVERRYCENCGEELTEKEIMEYEGLCSWCYEEGEKDE